MLTCEEACKIGQKACIDAIGYEFAVQNKSRSLIAAPKNTTSSA